jgi:hypothetical protein
MSQPLPVDLTPYYLRIGAAAFRITEKMTPEDRANIDRLLRRFRPQLAESGDRLFPVTVRRHQATNNRTTDNDKASVLYFHAANAVLTYYNAVLGMPMLAELRQRTELLEDIAKRSPNHFVVAGNGIVGHYLVHKDARPVGYLRPGGRNTEHDTDVESAD